MFPAKSAMRIGRGRRCGGGFSKISAFLWYFPHLSLSLRQNSLFNQQTGL
jgi:hypothetical protein